MPFQKEVSLKRFQEIIQNIQQRVIEHYVRERRHGNKTPFAEKEYVLYCLKIAREAAAIYGIEPLDVP